MVQCPSSALFVNFDRASLEVGRKQFYYELHITYLILRGYSQGIDSRTTTKVSSTASTYVLCNLCKCAASMITTMPSEINLSNRQSRVQIVEHSQNHTTLIIKTIIPFDKSNFTFTRLGDSSSNNMKSGSNQFHSSSMEHKKLYLCFEARQIDDMTL